MEFTDSEPGAAPTAPVWTLGDRLAKARRHAGLEQKDMARLLDVSPGAISQWENDVTQPRRVLDVCQQWAETTNVPFAWLVSARSRWFSLEALPAGQMELPLVESPLLTSA